ncbi:aegerolysin family protein [Kitasatospora sp. NPDC127121]|uniref:aegerolysin family protein n=1 Tax=unclassified Kitasatospora TaxID=2633591 RepID=UPI0036358F56
MRRTTPKRGLSRTAAGVLTAVLMASGALTLAPAAQAATGQSGPQATADGLAGITAARSTQVTLSNHTAYGLTKTWEKLDHGCWTNNMLPPDYIPTGKEPSFASESCGAGTGTEGNITYGFAGGEIKIYWNNPYVGSNGYSCSVPAGYACYKSGGSGNNAGVKFDVWPASRSAGADTADAVVPGVTAARSTSINLTNNSGKLLVRSGSSLRWGIWSDNMLPPSMVQPGVTAKWASESDGFMTGTEGEVTFDVSGESNKVRVYWNNPYTGSNGYSCSAPSGYKCTWQGGSGDNAAISFNLSKS